MLQASEAEFCQNPKQANTTPRTQFIHISTAKNQYTVLVNILQCYN